MTYQKLLKEQMKRAATLGKEETAVKLLILELKSYSDFFWGNFKIEI